MSIDIDAIRARAEAATSGRWEVGGMLHDGGYYIHTPTYGDAAEPGLIEDDAIFIAHAREDVPALLDEVDGLRLAIKGTHKTYEENRRLRAAVNAVRDVATHCDFDCGCTECMMARAVLAALDEHLGEQP